MGRMDVNVMGLMAVVAALVVLALLLGKRFVTTTETEVITRVAEAHVDRIGGTAKVTDCAARPATSPGLWLVVSCRTPAGAQVRYFVDQLGDVVDVEGALAPARGVLAGEYRHA